jgi:hypothetical protein
LIRRIEKEEEGEREKLEGKFFSDIDTEEQRQ